MMVGRSETLVPMGVEPLATELRGEELEDKLNGLRDNMVVVTDTLGDKLQTLEDMVLAVLNDGGRGRRDACEGC